MKNQANPALQRALPVPVQPLSRLRRALRTACAAILFMTVAMFSGNQASAQPVQIIHPTNTVWNYLTNKTDPGFSPADAWTAPSFDDSSWPTGKGYFGFEPTAANYNPGSTVANPCNCFLGTHITPPGSAGPISSYFRTHFNWTNSVTQSVTFVTTNWVDDSLIVYLNGAPIYTFNVTKPLPILWNDASPSGSANPLGEGVGFVTNVITANLVPGDNVLAVQLQQVGAGSSDDVFTMTVWAVPPTPIVITQSPTNRTVAENRSISLNVTATGTAPSYQWFKDNVALTDATNAAYNITNTAIADTGDYKVVVSNSLNVVTSAVARLTVTSDTVGPVLLSVKADETFRKVTLLWDELIASGSAIEAGNYIVMDSGGNVIGVSVSEPPFHTGNKVVLTLDTALITNANYTIEIDNQFDLVGNPTLPVGMPANDPNGIVTNFHAFLISPGFTRFQAYLGRAPAETLDQFIAGPDYPNNASFSFYTNTVYWPQSTPLPNGYEQYVMRFSGLFVAPETGVHVFNPDHDDSMRLRIYGNEDPSSPAPSELAAACCTGLLDGPTLDVSMVAGQRYYFELLVREFGGGDHAGISVVLPSGITNSPITGQYLATAFDRDNVVNVNISQQPQNQSIEANHAATFSVTATNTGGGVAYQWQRNSGSGFTDIPGATGPTYTTALEPLGSSGHQFRVLVSVPGRTVTSSAATLTVTEDNGPPQVTRVRGNRDLNGITVTFNEAMNAASIGNTANYVLRDSANVVQPLSAPVVAGDNLSVRFTTPAQTIGGNYTLQITGAQDLAGNPNVTTNLSFRAWVLSRGFVLFEAYATDGTSILPGLTNNANYPNNPRDIAYITALDSRLAYPDDTHESYGGRISGYFVAPTTTNYNFYLRSDDASELNINTNAVNSTDPAGRTTQQFETGCCRAFSALGTTNFLNGGQAYYIEVLWKEGTGGDFAQVAVKNMGDPTNPDTLTPIRGTFLATLADPVGASLTITQQPANVTIGVSSNTTLSVRASATISSGASPIAYQWQRLVGGSFVDISGASSSNYNTGTLTAGDSGAQYRALVFIPGATATSSVATVTVGGTVAPSLRMSRSGNALTLSWDAGARLQFTTSLNTPVVWRDVDTGGATTYTVNPSNEFSVNLDAAQEGVVGGRTGTGSGTVTLSNNVLVVDVVYSGLSAPRNNSHFHAPAARGANTGVAYDVASIATGTTSGTVKGLIPLANNQYGGKSIAAQIQDLRNGLWYLNIHSTAFAGGEIRGQVEPGARFYRLISP